jgi:radical SAM protein with 4Fe4S-binding SPASM domain
VLNQENIGELIEIYNNIKSIGINRWTVSFPRFVEKAQLSYFKVPPIKTMIREFKKLLKLYFKDNKPFIFTFSYFYKHELLDEKFHKLSIPKKEDHPCLPDSSGCKGLIVDSFGNLLDCLVMPPLLSSPTNIRDCLKNNDVSCLMKKIYDSLKSPYYELSLGQFETCWHCRYRNLCRGGCPANMWWLTDKLNTPDVISCALFYIFEKEILKLLPMNEKKKFTNAIDLTKPIKNIKEIIKSNKKTLIQIGLFH